MTQLTLGVAISAFKTDPDVCPMTPHTKEQVLSGKAPEVKDVAELRGNMAQGISTRQWKQDKTDSSKFEKKDTIKDDSIINAEPEYDKEPISIAQVTYPLSVAGHHLIPGLASLPKSDIRKYIWKNQGNVIDGDICYNVDGAENGKWLPTHQVMSYRMGKSQAIRIVDDTDPSDTIGKSWKQLSEIAKKEESGESEYMRLFLPRYTQKAMKELNSQFHDSHSDYSTWVKNQLDNISVNIDMDVAFCEECKKSAIKSPPYLLVYRLNMLFKQLDLILSGTPKNIWRTVYTSEFSKRYLEKPLTNEQLGS